MRTDLGFIKESIYEMAADKFDNMYESEISADVYKFLKGKEKQVAEKAYRLMASNAIVNQTEYVTVRAMDDFGYDLIMDWDVYSEFEGIDELTDEVIENCSQETMNEIVYDALYNYDALWMTAIHKSFPNDVTGTQCGYGMIEIK